jgi:predicted MPP superfamily phosphohydrolase
MHDLPRPIASPLLWCAFVWIGILGFLLPLVLLTDGGRAILSRVRRSEPHSPERREAIARTLGVVTGAAAVVLAGGSLANAELGPIVKRISVRIPGLGPTMAGYRIAQISDIHVSATIGRALIETLVTTVNSLSPDVVALTGDLVDGSVEALGPLVAPLANLSARDGAFFVTGNHEYISGVEEWLAFLPSLGFHVLRNEHVSLGGTGGFDLAGIDDLSGGDWVEGHGPNLERALAERDMGRPVVLLAHRPDRIEEAAKHGVALQLSGHTHGGQIAPVGWGLERLHLPYVYGMYEVNGTQLYVTSGAGYWGPPMRCGTRAEIVLFELLPG